MSASIAKALGSPYACVIAAGSVVIWGASGPMFELREARPLVINTGTTIVTFLMVFLIQNAQSRNAEALQFKLDEIIFATSTADNAMSDTERLEPDSLDALRRADARRRPDA